MEHQQEWFVRVNIRDVKPSKNEYKNTSQLLEGQKPFSAVKDLNQLSSFVSTKILPLYLCFRVNGSNNDF